jgi:hypothetical protein
MKDLSLMELAGGLTLLVLLFLVVFNSLKGKPVRPFLYFFIVPVILMGWPTIQRLIVNETGITLEKTVQEYRENPTAENEAKVEKMVEEVKKDSTAFPGVLIKVAAAEHAIGKNEEAKATLEEAKKKAPLSKEALILKKNIDLTQKIEEKLIAVETRPTKANTDSLKIYRNQALRLNNKSYRLQEKLLKTDGVLNTATQ